MTATAAKIQQLLVVLGAGVSHAAARTPLHKLAPPLTAELFDERYDPLLAEYPLVWSAAAQIRRAIGAKENAEALEEALRERFGKSDHPLDRKVYAALPCYLQAVLHEASHAHCWPADNLDLLYPDLLRRVAHVVFVTLNYDTLLDDKLSLHERINGMGDYIHPERSWSLIKLHGSVNWGRAVKSDGTVNLHEPDPVWEFEPEIVWRDQQIDPVAIYPHARDGMNSIRRELRRSLDAIRLGESMTYYPALALPLGADDHLEACHPPHLQFLKGKLDRAEHLDLLVIGYSGLDRQLLEILVESGKPVRSCAVVNQDRDSAEEALNRLAKALSFQSTPSMAYSGDFESFVRQREGLDEYLARLAGLRDTMGVQTTGFWKVPPLVADEPT